MNTKTWSAYSARINASKNRSISKEVLKLIELIQDLLGLDYI